MEKKEIDTQTTIKSLLIGFVSYGIITIFICVLLLSLANYCLEGLQASSSRGLYITLPLLAVIFIYFITHLICKMSTYDVFKKYKTNSKNYKSIVKYLNIFFITCIILSILIFLGLLYLNLEFQLKSIELAETRYKEVFSEEHITLLKNDMMNTYNESKTNLTISTVILELGFAISFLSLIPYQRKMIKNYNNFNEIENKDTDKNNTKSNNENLN